jgi:chemotaxis protein methyltransferase CheR
MIPSAKAVSLGLIVTELVINALKYAFRTRKADALILVTYEVNAKDWTLIVADNGSGKDTVLDGETASASKDGLGTTIVKALAKQLDARMELASSPSGLSVSVTRATFTSRKPQTI